MPVKPGNDGYAAGEQPARVSGQIESRPPGRTRNGISQLRALDRRARAACRCAAQLGVGAGCLAEPADQARRSADRGRRRRHDGAAHRQASQRPARPAGGGGEPGRRRRHHRGQHGGALAARRLHADLPVGVVGGGQRAGLQEPAVRPDQGPDPGHARRSPSRSSSSSIRNCPPRTCASSSPCSRPTPASTATAPRASARCRISPASCSSRWRVSTSCTFPIAAIRRSWETCSQGASR